MTMSELSEDLVEEILCRIPAISLNRLQYTCKRWKRLFSDSRFTRKLKEKAAQQFLVLMLTNFRVCLMSVNLRGSPSVNSTGELSLIDPDPSKDQRQLDISRVFHCDGLLLCTDKDDSVIVVWNPCTVQTRWIQPRNGDVTRKFYALGSYLDIESGNKSYKILSYGHDQEFEIHDMNSGSWRVIDANPNCHLVFNACGASLKGKTYWFASHENEIPLGMFLVSFDYNTERFERLPRQFHISRDNNQTVALSVVREEKLAVLLKGRCTSSETEIWLTNKIDETKAVSWTKVLALDLSPDLQISKNATFLLDEEKKVIVCCDRYFHYKGAKNMVYTVGEDNTVRKVDVGVEHAWPFLFTYVQSFAQIQQGIGGKRKRDD